jgi:hypothetical protein
VRALAATVLTFEAIVVFFASLVAMRLSDLSEGTALTLGGALAVACLLVAGLLRYRWGYTVGWVLQGLIVASGFVVPAMFFLGAVFALLWVAAIRTGRRLQPGPPAT